MKFPKGLIIAVILAACLTRTPLASAIVIGQVDNFEDGTTQDWIVGLLGASHPAPPTNIPNGGPLGFGDNYLQLTSVGGTFPGNRLTVINLGQWAGNYTTAGITEIAMDLKNLGAMDLSIRLYLENPVGGPPTAEAITSSVLLPAGGEWTHVEFAINPLLLTVLSGDVDTLLTNVTALRIFDNPAADFPGPSVVALLGIDNIVAHGATPVPEPTTMLLLGLGLVGVAGFRKKIGM